MARNYLLLALFSLAIFNSVNAVFNVERCYKCEYYGGVSNETTKGCLDNTDVGIVECAQVSGLPVQPKHWQCVKVVGKIEDADGNNHDYIKRDCIPGLTYKASKDCKSTNTYETTFGFVKRGKHCVCDDQNECNTGSGLAAAGIVIAIGLLTHFISCQTSHSVC